jgi:hypothetical protein
MASSEPLNNQEQSRSDGPRSMPLAPRIWAGQFRQGRVHRLRPRRVERDLDAVMGLRQNPWRGDCPPE